MSLWPRGVSPEKRSAAEHGPRPGRLLLAFLVFSIALIAVAVALGAPESGGASPAHQSAVVHHRH